MDNKKTNFWDVVKEHPEILLYAVIFGSISLCIIVGMLTGHIAKP